MPARQLVVGGARLHGPQVQSARALLLGQRDGRVGELVGQGAAGGGGIDDEVDRGRAVLGRRQEREASEGAVAVGEEELAVVDLAAGGVDHRVILRLGQRRVVGGLVRPLQQRRERRAAPAVDLTQRHDVHGGQRNRATRVR